MPEQPDQLRDLAIRYRRLATTMSDPDTIKALTSKAMEFDEQAEALESDDRDPRRLH